MAEALRMNKWLEEIQGPIARLREQNSISKALGQAHDMSKYLGYQLDEHSSCGAIAATMRSNNSVIDSITSRSWSNGIDAYNKSVGVFQSDLFDKINSFGRFGLATNPINSDAFRFSTLNRIQDSFAVFQETSALENTLKSIGNITNINSVYGDLISKHTDIINRINPSLTTWLNTSLIELGSTQNINARFDISLDGTVTGFGSSITIDEIRDFISNKIKKIGSAREDRSIEQKITDYFEPFCSRHPIIKFILLIIILQAIIGVCVNNSTDSSDKILKYIDQKNAILLKEFKREIKRQDFPPQALSSYRVVSTRHLIVKSSNSRDSKTVGTLCFGQVVEILNKKRHWTLVEYRRDNEDTCIRGWVYTRYLGQLK